MVTFLSLTDGNVAVGYIPIAHKVANFHILCEVAMKAVQIARFGGPDVLEMVDIPIPSPGPGQMRVRVHASGINYFECLMRANRYAITPELPMIPGVEVAGIVEAHGQGVSSPRIGARVAAPLFATQQGSGGYAEYAVIDANALVELPDELAFETAAALMVQGLTALHLVRQSRPAGKDVLVNAAAGGVGSLLVQLAREAGARKTVAAASSPDKVAFAKRLGADDGVNYLDIDWIDQVRDITQGKGADIIYETVGGAISRQSIGALAAGGEMVFGALGRFGLVKEDLDSMFEQNQSIRGFALLPLLSPDTLRSDLASLFEKTVNGNLKVTIGGCFRLAQAAAAHHALESRSTTGKVVLTCVEQ